MTTPDAPRTGITRATGIPGRTGETLLFWGLLALYLLPLWVFPFFPTQDGPDHQALSFILRQYGHPGAGLLREYYLMNREAVPNWFIFFLMSRALGFVSIPMAEKILLTAYVVLFPLSVRYAAAGGRPAGRLPRRPRLPLHLQLHVPHGVLQLLLQPAGVLFHPRLLAEAPGADGRPVRIAGLALLILWVYFCHPVTLVVAVAALLTLAGWRVLLERLAAPRQERFAVRGLWDGAPPLAARPRPRLPAGAVPDRLLPRASGRAPASRCCRCG